ncbi:DNA gyrase inhibitor YacG [Thermodesulfobacterium hveragerdense]|uniref:DNA gyrase inhibitor YacG n=1 Tax=Thermodesulfobacterium hveragerdense TaxID=53424 RepID=UPI000419A129|nr:DNA gyrase inhibitor YacG [Thermodesulfobacterium hveragerdense]
MKCPICHKKIKLENNPYRPFCSKECKFVDLYNWLKEEYKIKEEKEWLENALPQEEVYVDKKE